MAHRPTSCREKAQGLSRGRHVHPESQPWHFLEDTGQEFLLDQL